MRLTHPIRALCVITILAGIHPLIRADEAPAGIAAPSLWLAPGQSAERVRGPIIAALPDAVRYRIEVWSVSESDGTPAADQYGGSMMSGVYTATDDGTGWICSHITLEGQCLPSLDGDIQRIRAIDGYWFAERCLERAEDGSCAMLGGQIEIDDLSEHHAPPPAPGVSEVGYVLPNTLNYFSGEFWFTVPNSEQSQVIAVEARMYHPDTGALEHTVAGTACNPADGSNLCVWQSGWCAPRSDGGGHMRYEIHVQTIGGTTSAAGREDMYLNCP